MAPRPRIRVAVAQLAYHPAARIDGRRSPREDPLFVAGEPSSLRPPGVDLPAPLEERLRGLERRIREVHDRQLELRLRAIVASCRRWGVDLLVLPEYSAPAGLLRGLAEAAGEVMVVAGSHVVDRESLRGTSGGGVYGDLGWQGDAAALHGCAVAPVLHRGRMVHLQAKLHSADPASERADWARMRWEPVRLPRGGGEFGVLFGEDLIRHRDERWRHLIAPRLNTCELFSVLHFTRLVYGLEGWSAGEDLVSQAAPQALDRFTLLAMDSATGSSRLINMTTSGSTSEPRMFWGEEGLQVADLDLDARQAEPVASPSLVYRAHPVGDEYAAWSTAFAAHLADAAEDDLGELIATCAETRNLLLSAGALMEGDSRDRRLRRLTDVTTPPTSLDELRALTREVVLPRACLPFDHLCVALGRAAHAALRGWLREAPSRAHVDAGLACVDHLEQRIGRLPRGLLRAIEVPTADLWSDAGREALADVDAALHNAEARTEETRSAPEASAGAPREAADNTPARAPGVFPTPAPTPAQLDAWLADYRGLAKVWSERRMALLRDTDELFEPPLALTPGADDPRPALGLLDAWAAGDAPIGLLLGDTGVGKSTLLIVGAARRGPQGRRPLPLIVRLDWSRRADDPLATLLDVAGLEDTPTARLRLRGLIDGGALLPCFDGFDEALARLPDDAHRRLLAALLVLVEGGGRLLIASRSDVFADESAASALVDAAARPRASAATRIHLQPFSDRQVAGLIRKLAGDSADTAALIERLTSHYDLEHLARRPLLLTMVLRTLGSLDPTTWVTAADLYEAYFDRWQADADALPEQPLDADERALVLEALALTIWDRAASDCTAADLRRAFLRDLAPELAERGDAELCAALAVGLPAGFVAGDPAAGLRFTHTSYVEFFVARALVRHLGRCRERLLGIRALSPAIVDFVDQLLRRRGGDALAGHWQQALTEWVTSRERVERRASPWLGNAQRVLDGLAARRGEGARKDMSQETAGSRAARDDSTRALGEADSATEPAPSPRPAPPSTAKPAPRREHAQSGGAARSIDAVDSEVLDFDADTDEDDLLEAERDATIGSRAPALAEEAEEAAPFELVEEAAEAAQHPQAQQAQQTAWTVDDDSDDDDPPSRGPPPDPGQRRRTAPPGAPPAQSLATPPPRAHAASREPSAKKRLLLSKANLTSKAAPAVRERNRFLPGRPLADPELPGREDILREFSTLLDQASPALLKGPRRAGKSSILRAIQGRERDHRQVLRRDLERAGLLREPGDLARLLFPELRDDPDPAEALWRQLEDARDAGEPPPALLLDELAYLREGSDALFAWLRALGQEGLAGLVLAGSHADWIDVIRQANQTPGSSFGNDYTVIELGPLSDAEAIRFLVVTAPDDVAIDPTRTAKWIVDLCGGWPFYLQVMGYAVVEEVRSGRHAALVRPEALRDLYERRLLRERGPAVFGSRWGDLRRPAQELLLAELERARDRRTRHLTPYKELPRHARAILSDADLIDAVTGWKIDRPFADWLHRNLDELELSHG